MRSWVLKDVDGKWEKEDDWDQGAKDVIPWKQKAKVRKGGAMEMVGKPLTKTKSKLVMEASRVHKIQWAPDPFDREIMGKEI